MYAPLFNNARNWKWMVPATLIPFTIVLWGWVAGNGWTSWTVVPAFLTGILVTATAINIGVYLYEKWSKISAELLAIKNATPEVRMFEAAKTMHPDAVKALLVHRRSVWRIKYVPAEDIVDWIFDEIPMLHAGFVDFVLDHSNVVSLMSKRLLSEGSMQFDPEKLVTDYEQYDALINLMQAKLMCTQAFGNQAPKWLPPWSPDLVRHRFGLDGAPYAVEEDGISEAMQAVMRAQAQWQEKGLKDLEKTEGAQKAATKPAAPVNGNGNGHKAADEPKLTAEQVAAVEAEIRRNASQYRE